MFVIDWILIGPIVAVVAIIIIVSISLMAKLYYNRWREAHKGIESSMKECEVLNNELKALKLKKAKVDYELVEKDKEISTLKIEIDASVEQLSREQSTHRLQEG